MKSIVGTESQGRTLASKLTAAKHSNSFAPGPGQYTPHFTQSIKKQPGWRIGTSIRGEEERNELRRNYPPPDTYTPNMTTKARAAGWKIGTSLRDEFGRGNKNPGPNNYSPSKSKAGPAYGMGLKLENQSLIG